MKNIFLTTCSIIFFFSCNRPSETDGYTKDIRIIKNNSNHIIKIKNMYHYDLTILKNDEYLLERNSIGFHYPLNTGNLIPITDSVEVIFDDTLTVFHGSKLYTMFKDIRRSDMFDFDEKTEETNEGEVTTYTYTYTFTNADYDEAKTK